MPMHGGNIWAAAAATGTHWTEWADFSASVNPLGPPPWVVAAVQESLAALPHYPEPDAQSLRTAAAQRYGLPPDHIVFGPGVAALIHLLCLALRPPAALVPAPTFARYAAAARAAGAAVCEWPLWPEPAPDRLLDWMRRAPASAVAFLCNPNNPTGRLLDPDLIRTAAAAAERGPWLVVDEAFLEFTAPGDGASLLPLTARHPRLVVLRSLTKLYAIPGLRVGYLAAPPDLVRHLVDLQGPWPVGAPAAAAALAALSGPDYAGPTRAAVAEGLAQLRAILSAQPGWEPYPTDANFLLVRVPGGGAALQQRLLPHCILIRTCAGFTGLGDGYVRLAVRTPAEHRRLALALAGTGAPSADGSSAFGGIVESAPASGCT